MYKFWGATSPELPVLILLSLSVINCSGEEAVAVLTQMAGRDFAADIGQHGSPIEEDER